MNINPPERRVVNSEVFRNVSVMMITHNAAKKESCFADIESYNQKTKVQKIEIKITPNKPFAAIPSVTHMLAFAFNNSLPEK